MNDQKLWAEKMIERADERAEEAERELRTLLGRIEAWAAQAAINVEAQLTLPGGIDYERMVARVALLDAETHAVIGVVKSPAFPPPAAHELHALAETMLQQRQVNDRVAARLGPEAGARAAVMHAGIRAFLGQRKQADVAQPVDRSVEPGVGADLDLRVDPGGAGVDDGDAGEHVALEQAAAGLGLDRGEVEQLFGHLRSQIATEGFTCYAYPDRKSVV